ncbi:phage gp46-like protein [Humitalea rosea]|uniref:Phage gp46-like protein n=1 Tax=Humitalea rosea TaxID=990373 RepID=A0A2W7J594_9PROT|nr:phage GP46 family protein [Humitalea rosea]PZW46846.1 phage gp46-like protein [Humitalea rosea]
MIALGWDNAKAGGELLRTAGGGLAEEDGLATCVLISLFCDRRARSDDEIPDGTADRRGWVGDALGDDGDRWGSRLWLLARAKRLAETLRRAEDYAAEALAWLREDGLADTVDIAASYDAGGRLVLGIAIARPGVAGVESFRAVV